MFKCKNCGTEMVKVYAFEDESSQYMECPNCGNATKKRPIEYDDNGRLVTNSRELNTLVLTDGGALLVLMN